MQSAPEPVLLVIADISGYTQFMTANAKTLAHSQAIITELVTAIIREVELPLAVAKLEGDAVFLYARKDEAIRPWKETKQLIGARLLGFFEAFDARLQELRQTSTCGCHACSNLGGLKLKLVVHSGEALFHHVFGMSELAGVDVIIVHRLLKNSVAASQYILVTEAAADDLELPVSLPFTRGAERFSDIGEIKTVVYLPTAPGSLPAHQAARLREVPPFKRRLGQAMRWWLRLWFRLISGPFIRRRGNFRNLEASSGLGSGAALALFCLVLTPLLLPVGLVFVFFKLLARQAAESRQFSPQQTPNPL